MATTTTTATATNINISAITKDIALQRARNYRGAKNGLQIAIAWAVGQVLQGNADGMTMVMEAAGLLAKSSDEKMTTYADGRAVWAYVTTAQDRGGIGLTGIIRWDKDRQKFAMAKGWKAKADQLDYTAVVTTLSETRWDTFKAVPADKAFDLDKAIQRLITRAANEGVSYREIQKKFKEIAEA